MIQTKWPLGNPGRFSSASGKSCVWYGEALQHHEAAGAGEFVYIPASVPHMPYNPSGTMACVAIIARTDPNEQKSVVLLPDLEAARAAATSQRPPGDNGRPVVSDTSSVRGARS